jgi:hypothetical protein
MTKNSLLLPDLPLIALVAIAYALQQEWVLAITCSIAVTGIAVSIAFSSSSLCISGDTNEKSLRCTTLNFHAWEQCLIYMIFSLN